MSNKSTNEEVSKEVQAQEIIRNHVIYSMGGSLIPIPLLDLAAVTAIQLDMIKQLSNLYQVDYTENNGKAMVGAITGNIMARIGASLVKGIPGIGTILGGISLVILSGAATYALGDVFARHASEGGTLENLDIEVYKKYYKERYEEGKEKAKAWREEMEQEIKEVEIEIKDALDIDEPKDDQSIALQKLKELGELKEKGVISAQEFGAMKKQIKADFKDAGKTEPKASAKKPATRKKPAAKKPAAKKPSPKKKSDDK